MQESCMEKAIAGHFACASHPKRPDDDEDDWNMTLQAPSAWVRRDALLATAANRDGLFTEEGKARRLVSV